LRQTNFTPAKLQYCGLNYRHNKLTKSTGLSKTLSEMTFTRNFCAEPTKSETPRVPSGPTSNPQDLYKTTDDRAPAKIPPGALYFSVAVYLPLFIQTGTVLFASPPVSTSAGIIQLTYGACLLSFSGGASCWGPALTGYTREPISPPPEHNIALYSLGMVFPITACAAMLSGPHLGLLGLGLGYGLGSMVDFYLDGTKRVPGWFMKVKTPLTVATIAALGLSYWFLPETVLTEIIAIIPQPAQVAAEAVSQTATATHS